MPYPPALGQRPLEVHEAYAALEQFAADYGRDPLLLLMHAAVPETLRPDLLNLIRVNFLAAHGPDPSLEADVLFSPLSTALGGGYYRIDPQVRWHCLVMLRSLHRHAPRPRIRRIAELLWRYVEAREHQASRVADPQMAEFLDIQRWVALAFLEPASAAHAFADALRQVGTTGSTVALRLGGLASAIEVPLAGQPELLAYARGLDALAGGNEEEAVRLLGALGSDEIRVGDIVLKAPGAVLAAYRAVGAGVGDEAGTSAPRRRCLVIQAAGTKTDFATGRVLDMDASYRVIRETFAARGIDCFRVDELLFSSDGWPELVRAILSVDLVVCDLSTQDNAALHLTGVCLALRASKVFVRAEANFSAALLPSWFGPLNSYECLPEWPAGELDKGLLEYIGSAMQGVTGSPAATEPARPGLVYTLLSAPPMNVEAPPALASAEVSSGLEPPDDLAHVCFVIQGFGLKTDLFSGRSLDLDKSFTVIKDALQADGLECVRLDVPPIELPGQALDFLLRAPLAIVDLSAGLPDVLLQLGLRHGLRPGQTLLLAEEGYRVPPELGTLRILRYKHLGEDVGSREAARLRTEIRRWLKEAMASPVVDSPVYLALPELRPPVRRPPAVEPEALAEDPVPPQPRPRVFISYVHEYRQYASPLARALKAEGIDVAWDMDLKAGDAWQERLTAMLDEADALVAVAGSLTAGRPNPLAELERARQQGKRLFPVLIDPIQAPADLLEHWVANTDGEGHIQYLSELPEDERPAILARTAHGIATALRDPTARKTERPAESEVQAPTAVWALTIRQRGDSALQFMLLIDGQRIDATVHFQRTLVDPLLRQLVSDTRLQRDTLQTLIHLLLPREFAALPAAGRYHLTLGPDTALLPWEQLFHNPADPFAHLFPPRVIRRLDGLRPPSLRRQPESLNALLIGNPQTAGTLPDQESGLPDLPGAQREVVGVMSALNAAGFTTSVGTDENASAVMSRIFARDYRILLISGNAVHEYPRPDGSKVTGFVLSDGVFLTALELQQMRTMPEVVFLNGCHAGRPVADSSDGPPRDMVLALLKAGVQVVVAPGWAVDDLGAATFSESFFTALASGSRFEDAVDTARQASAAAAPDLNTWAAYQAWGDPDYRLLPAPGSAA